MTLHNEQIVRKAYQIAEDQDLEGWVAAFTDDGTFTDNSIGVTYRGPDGLPEQVENYARAFPDMHRELYKLYVSGDIVVVQLALQATHLGPMHLPAGTLPPSRPAARRRWLLPPAVFPWWRSTGARRGWVTCRTACARRWPIRRIRL